VKDWRILPFQRHDAFENMAIDEAIFRGNQRGASPPTVRFYGWCPPAVSLGYFQSMASEINESFCRENGISIVRRPTGGKAVLHDHELTYSLVSREDRSPFPPGILGTYLIISNCLVAGLKRLGVQAKVAAEGRFPGNPALQPHCFSFPSRYEILVQGRKVCGSAQVRAKGAFLQHGSLLLRFDSRKARAVILDGAPSGQEEQLEDSVTAVLDHVATSLDPEHISQQLAASFEEILQVTLFAGALTPEEEVLKDRLLQYKYRTDLWNRSGKTLMKPEA
jgi:lipoate-protein ligase A